MPRLAVLTILAVAALLIGAALASITPGSDSRRADRCPTEQEARGGLGLDGHSASERVQAPQKGA